MSALALNEMVGRLNDLEVARLERFLLGADRVSLQPVRAQLIELQHGACFYCAEPLRAASEVDHVLPWSRHPDDRIDNLVVAHQSCTSHKKDFLAGAEHLRTWAARRVRTYSAKMESTPKRRPPGRHS